MAQGTLLSVIWQPGWEGVCVYMAEWLCHAPATITALTGYTPIQNIKHDAYRHRVSSSFTLYTLGCRTVFTDIEKCPCQMSVNKADCQTACREHYREG